MVELHLILEGGGQPNAENASIAYNTQVLRESLHSFFKRLLCRDDVSIVVSMEFGYRNAVQKFLKKDSFYLFVDLDAPKSESQNWFIKLATENPNKPLYIPSSKQKDVYFMIQEMEAWFLKQPTCFEKWAKSEGWVRRHASEKIEEYTPIMGKNIEEIVKPSITTANLLKHFFEKRIKEEKRKLAKYGKLAVAPALLDNLDVKMLELQDSELHRFKISV